MPEGPELRMNAMFINNVCQGLAFCGQPVKSSVSKNPEIEWESPKYTIASESRGKELVLFLHCQQTEGRKMRILFRFGMSGKFTFTGADSVPKHAHLQFRTLPGKVKGDEPRILSFVDARRFGSWHMMRDWGEKRGPDIMNEFDQFRANVLGSLKDVAFNRAICETMLNQKYFNGIGNYLRAEILYRAKIPPFTCARTVLQPLTEGTPTTLPPETMDLSPKIEAPSTLQLPKIEAPSTLQPLKIEAPSTLQPPKIEAPSTLKIEAPSTLQLPKIEAPSTLQPSDVQAPDILCLCRDVSQEVVQLKIGLGKSEVLTAGVSAENHATFLNWLQCYNNPSMSIMKDKNGRTIWFQGVPGPMAPKGGVVRAAKRRRVPDNPNPTTSTKQEQRKGAGRKPKKAPSERVGGDAKQSKKRKMLETRGRGNGAVTPRRSARLQYRDGVI